MHEGFLLYRSLAILLFCRTLNPHHLQTRIFLHERVEIENPTKHQCGPHGEKNMAMNWAECRRIIEQYHPCIQLGVERTNPYLPPPPEIVDENSGEREREGGRGIWDMIIYFTWNGMEWNESNFLSMHRRERKKCALALPTNCRLPQYHAPTTPTGPS